MWPTLTPMLSTNILLESHRGANGRCTASGNEQFIFIFLFFMFLTFMTQTRLQNVWLAADSCHTYKGIKRCESLRWQQIHMIHDSLIPLFTKIGGLCKSGAVQIQFGDLSEQFEFKTFSYVLIVSKYYSWLKWWGLF